MIYVQKHEWKIICNIYMCIYVGFSVFMKICCFESMKVLEFLHKILHAFYSYLLKCNFYISTNVLKYKLFNSSNIHMITNISLMIVQLC